MRTPFRTILLATGLLAMLLPECAAADDAYICDGGRLVYTRPETLQKLKETDPCISQFYHPAGAPADAGKAQRPAQAVPASPATAPMRPSQPAPAAAPAPSARNRDAAGGSATAAAPLKPALISATIAAPPRPKAPEAAAGADYRNVRIINAQQGADPFYRHER